MVEWLRIHRGVVCRRNGQMFLFFRKNVGICMDHHYYDYAIAPQRIALDTRSFACDNEKTNNRIPKLSLIVVFSALDFIARNDLDCFRS